MLVFGVFYLSYVMYLLNVFILRNVLGKVKKREVCIIFVFKFLECFCIFKKCLEIVFLIFLVL